MKRIDSNLLCPSCHDSLRPAVLACDACGIKVEGPFQLNEFAALGPEDLHFLRIFIQAEGRVRDMEAALGLSYPTIRTRLTALRERLAASANAQSAAKPPETESSFDRAKGSEADRKAAGSSVRHILEQLEAGSIEYEEALSQIRRLRSKP